MNFNDASYLISTYLIVQDGEIHSNELKVQSELFKNLSDYGKTQASLILSDDKNKIDLISLTNLLNTDSEYNKEKLIENLYRIAFSDLYLDPVESEFIRKVAGNINYNLKEVSNYQKKLEFDSKQKYVEKRQSFFKDIKEDVSKVLYDISGKNTFFEGNLLEGKEFVKKVKHIATKAYNDLDLAGDRMANLNSALGKNIVKLEESSKKIAGAKRSEKDGKSLLEFVKNLNDNICTELKGSLEQNINVLNKKKHTIDFFTIAFLGRTKAGKSTFHKVITGEETDDIGVGKLRTTRFRRTYNWENIRIVDTPGIGAPGGENDTNTARSIIDEADLICYVVTNDSIQETEFNFLRELKEKNKPLFIILNFKENLEHPIRLKKFLEKPLEWKNSTGEKSLEGHVTRIKEMVSKNYNPDLIEIIPVQLLAAKLAKAQSKERSKSELQTLVKGSNLAEYNNKIKQTIFRTGHLKKTQNIIDGCNYQANLIYKSASDELDKIGALIDNLKKERSNLDSYINYESSKTLSKLTGNIENTHDTIQGDLKIFAASNYENKDIGGSWKEFLEKKGHYSLMQKNLESNILAFQKNLKSRVEESIEDIAINIGTFKIGDVSVDITNYKFGAKILTGLASIAVFMVWNPVGWMLGLAIGISVGVSWLVGQIFDSKEKRVDKAINKIIKQIGPSIDEQKKKIMHDVEVNFKKASSEFQKELYESFSQMISGAEEIQETLESIKISAFENVTFLNKVFVYRILEHQGKLSDSSKLTEFSVNKAMSNIEIGRNGDTIKINSHLALSKQEQENISKVLQLNIEYSN